MDLVLIKRGSLFAFLAKNYQLLHNDSVCCEMEFHDWKVAGFALDDTHYAVHSAGKARWVLSKHGVAIANCERHAVGSQLEFSIQFDNRCWHIKPVRRKGMLTHEVWDDGQKIGGLVPRLKLLRPEIQAHFDQAPRLELAAFTLWLIGIHWVGVAGRLVAGRAELGV